MSGNVTTQEGFSLEKVSSEYIHLCLCFFLRRDSSLEEILLMPYLPKVARSVSLVSKYSSTGTEQPRFTDRTDVRLETSQVE